MKNGWFMHVDPELDIIIATSTWLNICNHAPWTPSPHRQDTLAALKSRRTLMVYAYGHYILAGMLSLHLRLHMITLFLVHCLNSAFAGTCVFALAQKGQLSLRISALYEEVLPN